MINIFILNWNSTNDIDNLMNSLKKSNNQLFRIVLIHNGSDDWTELLSLSEKYEHCFETHIIKNNDNLGYAGGNNSGLNYLIKRQLDGDILIANPDIEVTEYTLDSMLDAFIDNQNVGAVMIRTTNLNGEILYDSISLLGLFQKYIRTEKKYIETDYVAGSFFLVKREIAERLGLFDDTFFMYWEEVDLSFRIQRLGFKTISTTNSIIARKKNAEIRSFNAIFYSVRNSFLISGKYRKINSFHLAKYLVYMFSVSFIKFLKSANYRYLLSFFSGLSNGYKLKKNSEY
ncbi:glycosyltransferase family 2 protein [Vibrio cholerae]|nr:glycosyltransferase family 2 protein [Vibrio cholerae]